MVKGSTRERLEKAQAGQSLIEMAIGMVLLTMIMSAVIDLGRLWFSYLALEDAAGEAALFLTIFPYCAESTDIDPHHTSDPTFCADPDNAKFRAQHAMGNDFMARDRVDRILQESFLAAGAYAARPEVRELLTAYGVRRRR